MWFTWQAHERAGRAEKQADRASEVAKLERLGAIVDRIADAVEASALDPHAPRRAAAERDRLNEAIAASGFDLPSTSAYALRSDPATLPAVKREIEAAIGKQGEG